jgi:hypothetical protein
MSDEVLITRLAIRHSVSPDAVRTVLRALRSGGGMSQWSPGMTMVGDMFNNDLKSKLDAVCTELVSHIGKAGPELEDRRTAGVSYRSAGHNDQWWPANLGTPNSVGAQNTLRYAVFPETRRLAIQDGRKVNVYDTGDHSIFGVAQAQSHNQTLSFTSQTGVVRVSELPEIDF